MKEDSWNLAVELVASFVKSPARLSHLLERLPDRLDAGTRRSCQSLLYGTVRHLRLLEKALDGFLRRRPKPRVWASMLVASRELMEAPERAAPIVHHAVDRIGRFASKAEMGLVNAVLRKVPARLMELQAVPVETAEELAWRYSHPRWMVERWLGEFGLAETLRFLEWNQREPETFGRWQRDASEMPFLEATPWEGFFRLEKSSWRELTPFLEQGRFYVQNPAARIAPALLAESVAEGRALDLCAAPGGKSLLLEALLGESVAEIVAVDLAGPRFERLESNLRNYQASRVRAVAGDIFELEPAELGPFEGVLLDAPCSNSGVLQHKVDARWRCDERGLSELIELQGRLLEQASRFVAENGTLVYSTCSVDRAENGDVVDAFLASEAGAAFRLAASTVCLPWEQGRDGAGVFALRRSAPLEAGCLTQQPC